MSEWGLLGSIAALTGLASAFIIYPLKYCIKKSLTLVSVIFGVAFIGYFYWGGFDDWKKHLERLDSQKQAQKVLQSIKSPKELIDKLSAKLHDTPNSAKGWYLLGRLYSSQNEPQKAVRSFAKAYQLSPNDEQYSVNYAHSLWIANNQQFNEQIIKLFRHLLKNNQNQPDALAMLAMNAFIHHDYKDAIDYWQRLLNLVPNQSKEAHAIRKAIAKAQVLESK